MKPFLRAKQVTDLTNNLQSVTEEKNNLDSKINELTSKLSEG